MGGNTNVRQGTLALMVLRTLQIQGSKHAYVLAERNEQKSGDRLQMNHGTLCPALPRLEQEDFIRSHWGTSANHRRAKFRAGAAWQNTAAIVVRFLHPAEEA